MPNTHSRFWANSPLPFLCALLLAGSLSSVHGIDGTSITIVSNKTADQQSGEWGRLYSYSINDSKVTACSLFSKNFQCKLPVFNRSGDKVAFVSKDGFLLTKEIKTGIESIQAKGLYNIQSLDLAEDGTFYYSMKNQKQVNVYHLSSPYKDPQLIYSEESRQSVIENLFKTPKELHIEKIRFENPFSSISYSPDGQYIAQISGRNKNELLITSLSNDHIAKFGCVDLDICSDYQCCSLTKIRFAANDDNWLFVTQMRSGKENNTVPVVINWITHDQIPLNRFGSSTMNESSGDFFVSDHPKVKLTPNEITFYLDSSGFAATMSKTVAISNDGGGILDQVWVEKQDLPDWITVSITGESNNRSLTVQVNKNSILSKRLKYPITVRSTRGIKGVLVVRVKESEDTDISDSDLFKKESMDPRNSLIEYSFNCFRNNRLSENGNNRSLDLVLNKGSVKLASPGCVFITEPTQLRSEGNLANFVESSIQEKSFSFEIWFRSLAINSYENATLLSLSESGQKSWFKIYQNFSDICVSIQTKNGPQLLRLPGIIGKNLIHCVISVEKDSLLVAYVNGTAAGRIGVGQMGDWQKKSVLYCANDESGDHAWKGSLFGLKLYPYSLDVTEVGNLYKTGLPDQSLIDGAVMSLSSRTGIQPKQNASFIINVRYDANGDLDIFVPLREPYSIELVGVDGKAISTTTGNQNREYTFKKSSLASGIYMVRVTAGTRISSRMVIIP